VFDTLLKKRDFYAGGIMILLGAGITLNSMTYNTGTLMHMGPGMFPFILGCTLTFVGLMIFGTAVVTPLGEDETILPENKEWLGWGCILAGPVFFIVLGTYFGMVAATFSCVFVSAMGDNQATVKTSAFLAAFITVPGCFLFTYVLQLPFPLFKWAF
jgi:hypothetical protein